MSFFQEKQFQHVDALLKQGKRDVAIQSMSKWQMAYLALFQQKFPTHKDSLRREDFVQFWQQRRESLRLGEIQEFRFQAESGIDDADFVTGYLFYLLALKYEGESDDEKYEEYLTHAIQYDSLHAKQLLLHRLIVAVDKDDESYYGRILKALQGFDPHVKKHGSPGYLMLAKGYLFIALQARLTIDGQARSDAAFGLVFKYLYMAKFALDDSAPNINNAYFGQGLAKSNSFHFSTIEQMEEECIKLGGDSLSAPIQEIIKSQAERDYHMLCPASLTSKHLMT